ncbi:MAG: twin-arginine translocase subunit TatC [Planctomycetes bacterium]|nr:twin-arginine translocase subunit TatC [Planctomycetota bacterium]
MSDGTASEPAQTTPPPAPRPDESSSRPMAVPEDVPGEEDASAASVVVEPKRESGENPAPLRSPEAHAPKPLPHTPAPRPPIKKPPPPPPPEDEPEEPGEVRMGFLDHLMELRKRLFAAVISVLVMTVLCLIFHKPIFDFLFAPLETVNRTFRQDDELLTSVIWVHLPGEAREKIEAAGIDGERRTKLLLCYRDPENWAVQEAEGAPAELVAFLKKILIDVHRPVVEPISTDPLGLMMILMKVSVYAGLLLSSPIVLYELWSFVAPGLRQNERAAIRPVFAAGVIFFLLGSSFCYYIIFPITIQFLVWFDIYLGFKPSYVPETYMGLLLTFMILFGAMFEIPLVAAVLARLKLLHSSTLLRYWRYVVLTSFIFGSILSPGSEVISMLLMSGTLLFLYAISIVLTMILYPKA